MSRQQPSYAAPATLEEICTSEYFVSALFGYVSGLPDSDFLEYSVLHRDHPTVRRIFFSEIRKRPDLSPEVVDENTATILADIEDGKDRTKNETLIRYLFPHMSMQMRSRTFNTILAKGTKTTKSHLLRQTTPASVPGIEETVFELALSGNEDALVGVVYRWPVQLWRDRATELFNAANELTWLQRKIIFTIGNPDAFLDDNLITDPVTELYVRAKYDRPSSEQLIDSAIKTAIDEFDPFRAVDRIGLVAWSLGRFKQFEKINKLSSAAELARFTVLQGQK